MQLSASRIVAPAALAGWSLYSLCLIAGVGSQTARRTLSEVVFLSLAAAALVLALGRARAGWGRQSPAWAVVAVGLVGWFLAEAFEAVHPPGDGPPVPSVVDIGYLLLPLCICVSFLMAAATSARQSPLRLLLDGVIVTGSVFGVFWVAILRQLVAVRQPGMFAFVVALTHPLLDVVVIVVGLLLLASARLPRRRSVFLLWLGIVIMSVSNDVEFQLAWRGQDVGGGLLDIGWASALLAFVLAADQSRLMPDPDHRKAVTPPKPLLWLPYLPVLLATPVAATQWPHTDPVVTATGLVVLVAVLARQFLMVEENRRLLATIAEQAVRDPLTGLANRTLFDDRLAHAVSLCRRDARPLAVLTIDLDHFKLVNDRLGHAAGDQVLVQVARRIDACVRSGDTVARLGGDEFAVIVEDGRERADSVAQQIAESFTKPFVVDDQYLFIGPSVGVAIVDGAGTFEASAETLLKQSDAAMYAAKRSRAEFPLQAATDAVSAPVADASLLDRLRVAIDHGELDLLYQPKVSLSTGAIVGFEALVRWPHPTLGVLEPVQFLPLVRSNGLTGGLTDVVLGKALRDAAHWYSIGHRLPVAVNLFAPTFADPHLPKRITQLLGDTGLPAGCLTLEMTEDLMLHDAHAAATIVRSLRESGTRISIDDFGTGYCDLNYLRALPIDEVKLDRQFVVSLFDDPRALIIVRALVDLVHDLGMTCVAEGVEDAATAERLRELRCDVAQGFYYSAPVTFSALLAMLNSPLTEKSCSTGGGPAQP